MNIDVALLKKYDRPGPRYTSYPTAPIFQPTFTAEDFRNEIIATNGPGTAADLSLYVHIPFCDTLCFFCGCTMLVTRDRKRIDEYLRYLKKRDCPRRGTSGSGPEGHPAALGRRHTDAPVTRTDS